MRSFHINWFGFFMAFFIWFSLSPLLPEVRKSLKISKADTWTSSIVSVSGTIMMRFILGPLIDKYGARIPFVAVLCLCAIPTACTGFVETLPGLCILRFCIGLVGGSFVMCQSWTSKMFARKVVGTANAIAGGWGNLGGGVTQLFMGWFLFPIFKDVFNSADKSWRFICVIPAIVTFCFGIIMYTCADDLPKGNYSELKKHGTIVEISATQSFRVGAQNFNSWILAFQYACSFGVEITMHNAAATYFHDEFGLETKDASLAAALFGLFNIFSRGMGGYLSDVCNRQAGMRGRIYLQFFMLIATAAFVLWFQSTHDLWYALLVVCFFSITCQAACGTTYGIVPYVDPPSTGSISGIVGAGGNIGAVGFGLGFRQLTHDPRIAFKIMGFTIFVAAASCMILNIKGCSTFWGGVDLYDNEEVTKTLDVPELAKEQPEGAAYPTPAKKIDDDDVAEEYA